MTLSQPPAVNSGWALFLDVDGTLLDIAPRPDAVVVPPRLIGILERLQKRLDGALALVSGRQISVLDKLFAPLKLPAAGVHGLERRNARGELHVAAGESGALAAARALVASRGIVPEDKAVSLALHYRETPEREAEFKALADEIVAKSKGRLCVQHGKMVVELRPPGHDKGSVVTVFMAEPPFAGRVPVFVGDDLTDEDGFAAVNRLHGLSIRVGPAERSVARYVLGSVPELHRWLEQSARNSQF